MRILLTLLAGLVAIAVLSAAAILAFDSPTPPPEMASVEHSYDHVDFSKAPPRQFFAARDGTKLAFRAYPGKGSRETVVLIHGSSGNAASMGPVAEALGGRGAAVYALSMRGHDGTGRSGDIDYIGQLDDDLADFMKTLGRKRPDERRTLLGFSSGGGFVLRFAGTPAARIFDRFILVSPQLPVDSPVMRPNAGGWVSVAMPRIVVPPEKRNVQTAFYSYRMLMNFGPRRQYLADLKAAPGQVSLLAGSRDEIFFSNRYAGLLKPVRPDLAVTLVPGLGHTDMTLKPAGIDAIAATVFSN